MEFCPHGSLVLLLHDDIPRKAVNINAALAEDVYAMVPFQYSSIRPGFQGVLISGQQRCQQHFGRKPTHLGEFDCVQGTVGMK